MGGFPTATRLDARAGKENILRTSPCPMNHFNGKKMEVTDKGSESTGDLANFLSSMGAANILDSKGLKSTSPIPISIYHLYGKEDKRKGKEIMTELEKLAKAKVQEQMKIAKIHAEEDLRQMINELDRSNVMINKHMAEYKEAENDLTIEVKTDLITELVNYQKDFARIKKYQAQQQRLASKSKRRKFYTSVLRSHTRWKTKDLIGMTFDQLEEKFIPVWESIQDFVPMDSKKESESLKRLGILLEKVKAKRLKTSDVSSQEQQESDNQDEIINLQQSGIASLGRTFRNIILRLSRYPYVIGKFTRTSKWRYTRYSELDKYQSSDGIRGLKHPLQEINLFWKLDIKNFPLLVYFPTARFPLLEDFPLQHEDKIYT
ncbi:hypothetical protein Tco_0821483 [Tanacetum coccineum]|uniref:Uncharacterized protein n=1 Tax=Tanacetum coccineum TaxID=301880 RepID=A0ABQ5AGR0_9ASTR